ncbi:MAG: hypothetical protein EXS30_11025 [Pedosphaera sp.]|nr:hypothetical protein [Pedosphaera sp.]
MASHPDHCPLVCFEDEHLLVVNKPAGLNTHAPSPFAGEGVYEWLRHREGRWANLAIIHRLDKETSGILIFAKTALANRSLTAQFTQHSIRKKYIFLTDRTAPSKPITAISSIVRLGEKYVSRPLHAGGEQAETRFRVISSASERTLMEAEPITGRTHQIRVHAADHGVPVLGDSLYGGAAFGRLCLHSQDIALTHPATQAKLEFRATADFSSDARFALRSALIDPQTTNAYRVVHGASDGWPGWYVDRLGDYLLSQSDHSLSPTQLGALDHWLKLFSGRGAYHKILNRHVGRFSSQQNSPEWILGDKAPDSFVVLENGLRFELSCNEGYSLGIFLDQRENRRRFLTRHVAASFPAFPKDLGQAQVLNAFAYTCGFSVCAAKAGARMVSVDLSKKYLEWGRRNFVLNGIDPAQHEFIYGDVFDWFRRFSKKQRLFDAIILDPPTFSRSREGGSFQAERDYDRLVTASLPLLKPDGLLFASTNSAKTPADRFIETVMKAIAAVGRTAERQHYAPQPPDFPISRDEPAYLKTLWLRVR